MSESEFTKRFQGFFDVGNGILNSVDNHQYLTLIGQKKRTLISATPFPNAVAEEWGQPYDDVSAYIENTKDQHGNQVYMCCLESTEHDRADIPTWLRQKVKDIKPHLDFNQLELVTKAYRFFFRIIYAKGHLAYLPRMSSSNQDSPLRALVTGALFMIRVNGAYDDCIKMRLDGWVQKTTLYARIDMEVLGCLRTAFTRITKMHQSQSFVSKLPLFTSCEDILLRCKSLNTTWVPVSLASLYRVTLLLSKSYEDLGKVYKDPAALSSLNLEQQRLSNRIVMCREQ